MTSIPGLLQTNIFRMDGWEKNINQVSALIAEPGTMLSEQI